MNKRISNPFELWNFSRSVASVAYEMTFGDLSFSDVEEQYPDIPYNTKDELAELFDNLDGDTREELVYQAQQAIHEDLQEDTNLSFTDDRYQNQDGLIEWNKAQKVAGELSTWLDGDSDELYHELYQKYSDYLPQDAEGLSEITSQIADVPDSEWHLELTRSIRDNRSTEVQDNRSTEARAIAEELMSYFVEREYDNYRDVTDRFESTTFPARSVSMMEVVNSGGDTRQERIDAIVEWVSTWYDNPDRVKELNRERRRPMGMN